MKNIIIFFLFLFPFKITAQNIDFQFEYSSEEVPMLYLRCGNDIHFSISDSVDINKLNYSIRGGKVISENRLKYLTIVPSHSKVTLEIFYDKKLIKEQIFQVKLIPKPTVKVRNLEKVITVFPQKINLDVIADKYFKDELPYDARYKANEFTIFLYKDKELIMKELCINEKQFTQRQVKKFTKLIKSKPEAEWNFMIMISEVQRKNFQNEVEDVPIGYLFENFIFPIELE